jgi:hypothetical protein
VFVIRVAVANIVVVLAGHAAVLLLIILLCHVYYAFFFLILFQTFISINLRAYFTHSKLHNVPR